MKKLFMGFAIVIFSAFALSDALAATVEVLVVAGGGEGSKGGGGAGGIIHNSSYPVSVGSYTVIVGAGGNTRVMNAPENGDNSSFSSLVAVGGGGGGGADANGLNGGNGGGGGLSGGTTLYGGSGTSGQGYAGGGNGGFYGPGYPAGGGGGFGAVGGTASSTYVPGNGGDGGMFNITGTDMWYGGGGGGGMGTGGYTAGTGGRGGGGNGGSGAGTGSNGAPNTGGGGGGADALGGTGGSGIVIIRYVTADFGTCTGGTKTTINSGATTIHTFTSNGTFTVVEPPTPTPTPTVTPTPTPTPTKSMDSPGIPSAGSGMYTLSQVYDYLNSGIKATPVPSFREPGAGPGPTMKTMKEIYEDIQAKFDQCDVTTANVDSGKKFFSTVPGNWGVRTGTR